MRRLFKCIHQGHCFLTATRVWGKAYLSACSVGGKVGGVEFPQWSMPIGWSNGFKMNLKSTPIRMQQLRTIPKGEWPDPIHEVHLGLAIPG